MKNCHHSIISSMMDGYPSGEDFHRLKRYFLIFILLSLVEGLATFGKILKIPSDPKNAVLLGYSTERLLLLVTVLIGLLILLFWGVAFVLKPAAKQFVFQRLLSKFAVRLFGILGFIIGGIAIVPPEEWGRWEAAFLRLLPILIWVSLLFIQSVMVGLFFSGKFLSQIKNWIKQKIISPWPIILVSMASLIVFYLLSLWLYPGAANEDYWYENGVPFLLWQIFVAVAVGLLYIKFEPKLLNRLGEKINLALFLFIVISSGILWAATPIGPSHFNPGPYPPNNIYYPNSDAQKFDLQAQSTLLGLGFDNGTPMDRPYYPLFLSLIHLISGQIYTDNVALQAFLFGVFPGIIFLICTQMGSRRLGVMTAIAMALWGQNYLLVNSVLNTATPKQLLTDFPTAIILSLVLYFVVRWSKVGTNARIYAFTAGGMIALASYVRYSALSLFPVLAIVIFIYHRRELKQALMTSGVLLIGFIVVTMPWYARNLNMGKQFYLPFGQKILFVINERYQLEELPPDGEDSAEGASPSIVVDGAEGNSELGINDNPDGNDLAKPFLNWFIPHLTHNVISSLMILPSSLEISSIHTSLDRSGEIWDQYWDGKMSLLRIGYLLFEGIILSFGFIALSRRNKWIPILLILLFLGVNLSNALGRTSGGRYIVPVNWLVLVVYFAGIMYLLSLFDQEKNTLPDQIISVQSRWWVVALAVLFIGILPVLYEGLSMRIFSWPADLQTFQDTSILVAYGVSGEEVAAIAQFQKVNATNLIQGVAFYPTQQRSTPTGRVSEILDVKDDLSLLNFKLIQPGKSRQVVFPYRKFIDIQNQDPVILGGCLISGQVVVRDLFIIRQGTLLHYRSDYMFEVCN